jgi:threonine dehydratase
MKGVGRFHTSVEGYKVTPLISLESLAERLSVSKIISGESGAVGLGLLTLLLEREELKELKDRLKLNKNSVVICFSTEGDTDPEQYEATIETF